MARKEDGTVEHTISKSERGSVERQVINEIIAKHAIKDEVSLYSILKVGYSIWIKEQARNPEIKQEDEYPEMEFIKKYTKKFKAILEQILYKGVVDSLRPPNGKGIRLPQKAKESVLFLVGLGDAGKEYQEELTQLIKGELISSDALNYISSKIQLIFLHKKGMASKVQCHINMIGLSQTKEMFDKLGVFYRIAFMAAAITDISAYDAINSVMDKCNEIMKDALTEWCMEEKELPEYGSWIREKLKQELNDINLFSFEQWKNDINYDATEVPDR